MQKRFFLIFGILVLGLMFSQDSYASNFNLVSESDCNFLGGSWTTEHCTIVSRTITIEPGDTFILDAELELVNSIINNYGTLEIYYDIINDGTINNHGTFPSSYPLFNTGTINNYGTFENLSTLSNLGTINNSNNFINEGILTSVTPYSDSPTLNNTGTFDNSGSIVYGTIINSGSFSNSGIITPISFHNEPTPAQGTLTNNLDGQVYSLINNGLVYNNNGATIWDIENYFSMTNNGRIDSIKPYSGSTYSGDGTVGIVYLFGDVVDDLDLSSLAYPSGTEFGVLSEDQLSIKAPATLTIPVNYTFKNYGLFEIEFNGVLINEGTIVNENTIDVFGTFTKDGTLINNGIINDYTDIPAPTFVPWPYPATCCPIFSVISLPGLQIHFSLNNVPIETLTTPDSGKTSFRIQDGLLDPVNPNELSFVAEYNGVQSPPTIVSWTITPSNSDLSLSIDKTSITAFLDSPSEFRITLYNQGPDSVQDKIRTKVIAPEYVTFIGGYSPDPDDKFDPSTGIWESTLLPNSQGKSFTIKATSHELSKFNITAYIDSADYAIDPDSTPGNLDLSEDDIGWIEVSMSPTLEGIVDDTAGPLENVIVSIFNGLDVLSSPFDGSTDVEIEIDASGNPVMTITDPLTQDTVQLLGPIYGRTDSNGNYFSVSSYPEKILILYLPPDGAHYWQLGPEDLSPIDLVDGSASVKFSELTSNILDMPLNTAVTANAQLTIIPDSDGDGVPDPYDVCPGFDDTQDTDMDGIPNGCDDDFDNDGYSDSIDNCPSIPNPLQIDTDGDSIGDECDTLLLMTSLTGNKIISFEHSTGTLIGDFITESPELLHWPGRFVFDSNDDLLVTGYLSQNILKFDSKTGDFIDTLVPSGNPMIFHLRDVKFGPDGNIYVRNHYLDNIIQKDNILKFSPDGTYLGVFAILPDNVTYWNMEFGPDGNLYVLSDSGDYLSRYQGPNGPQPGSFIDNFIGPSNNSEMRSFTFGPNDEILISIVGSDSGIMRFQGPLDSNPGSFIDNFSQPINISAIGFITFGPDGNLFALNSATGKITKYDGTSGEFIEEFNSLNMREDSPFWEIGFTRFTETDFDGDTIPDSNDIRPREYSNFFEYLDLNSSLVEGKILTRGDQNLILEPLATGMKITSDSSGGILPAIIEDCVGSQMTLTSGDSEILDCQSTIIQVIQGPIEVEYFDGAESVATTTLKTGDNVTYDDELVEITNNGSESVTFVVNGIDIVLNSGDTASIDATDSDGDGIPDSSDMCHGFDDNLDNDADTIPDGCDSDDDNDGISDQEEITFGMNPFVADVDSDFDGIFDQLDLDTFNISQDFAKNADINNGNNSILVQNHSPLLVFDLFESDRIGVFLGNSIFFGDNSKFSLCNDHSTVTISTTAFFTVECGSTTLGVLSGSVDVLPSGSSDVISLSEGSNITFENDGGITNNSETDDTTIQVNGYETIVLGPGESVYLNHPPIAMANGPYLAAVGAKIDLNSSGSSDPDGDELTYTWSAPNCTVDDTDPLNQLMTCTTSGVFEVTLQVEDTSGETDSDAALIVVYDPEGGFVSGGGWIDSPEGSCNTTAVAGVCNYDVTGKATFGFVSKYLKGATAPSGNTQFHFQAGNLKFKSSDYDWLTIVIAGAKAQYKGTGTINGEGDYGFILTAFDADYNDNDSHTEDKFRIKIWDKTNEDEIVYDNKMGLADNYEDGTVIGGGSIVIHKGS